MRQHPSFTYETAMQSRFVMGGVVSNVTALDDLTRVRFSAFMARSFADEKPRLSIVGAGFLIKALGYGAYKPMLDECRDSGVLLA